MATVQSLLDDELHRAIQQGFVGILPTDTIYGLVAHAGNPQAVERVYNIKGRDLDKPAIILVPHREIIEGFGVPAEHINHVEQYWPGPLSVVFEKIDRSLNYLHRGKNSLAFRIPAHPELRYMLEQTGPIIAPSANFQGEQPVASAAHAQEVFADAVDFYVEGGELVGEPSTVVKVAADGSLTLLRAGAAKVEV